jgi:hypothetical protein
MARLSIVAKHPDELPGLPLTEVFHRGQVIQAEQRGARGEPGVTVGGAVAEPGELTVQAAELVRCDRMLGQLGFPFLARTPGPRGARPDYPPREPRIGRAACAAGARSFYLAFGVPDCLRDFAQAAGNSVGYRIISWLAVAVDSHAEHLESGRPTWSAVCNVADSCSHLPGTLVLLFCGFSYRVGKMVNSAGNGE